MLIRPATLDDAPALQAIYRYFVEETVVSFETVAPSVEEFAGRMAKVMAGWCWLVAESDGECVAYAYGSQHRERSAYRTSTETTVYVRPGLQRGGFGRALYAELLPRLAALGYCQAVAGITLPNDGSVGLHRAMGFEPVGVFRDIGHKFGAFRDVACLQRRLRRDLLPGWTV